MSASAGAGHPLTFMCTKLRRISYHQRTRHDHAAHVVERTGRTKPNPSRKLGGRSLDTLHEYSCRCGHVGWSSHPDVLRCPLAVGTEAEGR